jgi:peptidyl-prolyl cis-trans isomerase A (cyclophilin A)
MLVKRRVAASLCLAVLLAACSKAPEPPPPKKVSERAPEQYKVRFDTSKGPFIIEVHRDWAPRGADRFYNLIEEELFDGGRFFRVVRNFVVQWGIPGDPSIAQLWSNMRILDDSVKQSNKKGYVSYAKLGPASRTTQVFINLRDNSAALDKNGFAPFGRVTEGMEVVESLYSAYGDGPPRGTGPDQNLIQTQGNKYLENKFPRLDYIKNATFVP